MSKENQQVNPYPIRLTKELKVKLEESAKQHGRSLNAEMLLRLEASFTDSPSGEEQYLTAEQVRSLVREELLKAGVIEPEREQGYSIPMNLKKAR